MLCDDGTDNEFNLAPPAPQCWVLVSRSNSLALTIPVAFFLLPDKSYNTYHSILLHLRDDLGVPGPKYFHLDFESGAIKAVRNVFPESVIVGCDTHWKRCLR
jgi:hypothetical protein